MCISLLGSDWSWTSSADLCLSGDVISLRRCARPHVLLVLLLTATGCGAGTAPDASVRPEPSAPRSTGAVTASTAAAPVSAPATSVVTAPSCADEAAAARRHTLCVTGGAETHGLLVALHGRGSSAAEMRAMTGLDEVAAIHGLAVVYPEGLDARWRDDTLATPSAPTGDEDVVYLHDLITALRADPRIGTVPVALLGFSNGGSMAMRHAGRYPDDVAAVVSVAGQLPRDPAVQPTRRVPLLQIHGTADPLRPFDTGIADQPDRGPDNPTPTLSTAETVQAFVAQAAGNVHVEGPHDSDVDPTDGTTIRTERWIDDLGTAVVSRAIVGGGHRWPGARIEPANGNAFGTTSRDLDATTDAIDFVLDVTR